MVLRGNQRLLKATVYGVGSALLLSATSLVAAAHERVTAVFAPAPASNTTDALPSGYVIQSTTTTTAPTTGVTREAARQMFAAAAASARAKARKHRMTATLRDRDETVAIEPAVPARPTSRKRRIMTATLRDRADRATARDEVAIDPTVGRSELVSEAQDKVNEAPLVPASATQGNGRELDCLARAVYFEARGESKVGQEAVAQVILARQRTPGRPHTVCGVVYQGSHRSTGCQFSFTCDRIPDRITDRSAWSRAVDIAQRSMAGQVRSAASGATFYHANYVRPYWASSMRRVATIGTHIFYRP